MKEIKIEKIEEKNEEDFLIKLKNSYVFEGETITEVDLSGLETTTATDMIKANKVLQASGTVSVIPETNLEYCLIIAASVSKYPIEFFKGLAPRDAMKVKNMVQGFFLGEE